jgi:uncharacterized cupredoxin-like copper-binding protein
MKKLLLLLLFAFLPSLAVAAGEHPAAHDKDDPHQMQGHAMEGMSKEGKETHASMAGKPGDASKVSRTIEIGLQDNMRFTPESLHAKPGETVRFLVKNKGKIAHEMVIGTMDELKEHAEMMRKMPSMMHMDANMVTLKPGQLGRIVWQFDKPGIVFYACLVPGHMEAGMVGRVTVE